VLFEGRDVLSAGRRELRTLRRQMQIVFQDPLGSLNERMRVGSIVAEPMIVHGLTRGRRNRRARVERLLESCGLSAEYANRLPHELSGGQRQRVCIARALALEPRLLVCDEPTSALDVSIQAQIINLLSDLKREFGLSLLFISHDLAVVGHVSDRIAVMKDGKLVEIGERDRVLGEPSHGYTRQLLTAVPRPTPPTTTSRCS
jgi:ABC-type glutathione transport system ATPase component